MKFLIANNLNDPRIIQFLLVNEHSSVYHHPAWLKAIFNTFSHIPYYVIIEGSDGNIGGLLPFVAINSLITGRRIVSLPFSTYCNPLISDSQLNDAIKFLSEQFHNYKQIEIRTSAQLKNIDSGFYKSSNFFTHFIQLEGTIENTLNAMHRTAVRPYIRKAEKNNLVIRFGESEKDLKIFYKYETSLRRRLSYPPLPYKFYFNIWNELKKYNLILLPMIEHKGRTIAAGFILKFRQVYYLEYAASDRNYAHLYPIHKLYWEVIKLALSDGAKYVDFGRTSVNNESLLAFKDRWNTLRTQLFYYYYPSERLRLNNQSKLKNMFGFVNRNLPDKILQLEGKIIYPHLS